MSIAVIKSGILDSLQDCGRYGYQEFGINPAGAMDKYAMQIANILVGNDPAEAVIEMHFPASVFHFKQPAIIALSGGDFSASINGEPVPNLHCIRVERNDVLHFHKLIAGARAYIASRGGFSNKKWLNSSSTNLKAAVGGFSGRAIQKNDELSLKFEMNVAQTPHPHFRVLPWTVDLHADASPFIYVLKGNEWDQLEKFSQEYFLKAPFRITMLSDRMGYRLENKPLKTANHDEMISSAVSYGTIQLLPDGKLILLMADHQTTGGYPRIAHVITAHHTKLAQMNAGDDIHFKMIGQQEAEDLLIKQMHHLHQLQDACTFRLEEYFKEHGGY